MTHVSRLTSHVRAPPPPGRGFFGITPGHSVVFSQRCMTRGTRVYSNRTRRGAHPHGRNRTVAQRRPVCSVSVPSSERQSRDLSVPPLELFSHSLATDRHAHNLQVEWVTPASHRGATTSTPAGPRHAPAHRACLPAVSCLLRSRRVRREGSSYLGSSKLASRRSLAPTLAVEHAEQPRRRVPRMARCARALGRGHGSRAVGLLGGLLRAGASCRRT